MGWCSTRSTRPAGRVSVAAWSLALLTLSLSATSVDAQPGKQPKEKPGLSLNDPKAFQGYTLIAPMMSTKTYLIDMQGKVVRTWESEGKPATCAYLLPNGHLLRPSVLPGKDKPALNGPGAGGRIQEFDWDGKLVWDYKFSKPTLLQHHDITPLPNGNVLLIAWDKKTAAEATAAGRKTAGTLIPDCLIEIKPKGPTDGEVVWEWHIWDHLIQDHDKSKANFGDVAAHPELIDVNYGEGLGAVIANPKDLDKLKGIGYVGGGGKIDPDWTHTNCVDYNAELDQIMLSIHNFSEIWIIDHSTTTSEAAAHKGGKGGKGGDLLYRWGNPQAHRAGTAKDQQLFAQHNAHWIPKGLPGAGHVLVFNNGVRRPGGNYSSVDELVLPVDPQGRYELKPGTAYGPEKPVWSYSVPKKSDFFAFFISGAQRLANGDTLICDGPSGMFFEVTDKSELVWKYVNPGKSGFGMPGGGKFGPPQPGQVLPAFVKEALELTGDQKKELDEFQKDISGKLDKLLTDDQKKQLKDPKTVGFPQPGQLMPLTLQNKLKLNADQKKEMAELQKATDTKLDKLLTEDQKKQVKELKDAMAKGPGGPGGPGGMGNSVFRAYRYPPTYPGLVGRDLTPGKTLEELLAK